MWEGGNLEVIPILLEYPSFSHDDSRLILIFVVCVEP